LIKELKKCRSLSSKKVNGENNRRRRRKEGKYKTKSENLAERIEKKCRNM